MKVHFIKSCFMLFSLGLAACSTNTPAGSGATAPAVGTGPAIAQGDMPETCQEAAVAQYGVPPRDVSTDSAMAVDGGFEVKGGATGGAQGGKVFNCRFDASGKFLGLMEGDSATPTP